VHPMPSRSCWRPLATMMPKCVTWQSAPLRKLAAEGRCGHSSDWPKTRERLISS
jgi:hypothetical protein